MQEILDAIEGGASGEDIGALPIPESYRAAHVLRAEQTMWEGVESADKDPRKSLHVGDVPTPGAGARRGVPRGDGVLHQLQHGVDVDLRAAPHLRVPRPPRQGERVGQAPRPRPPRRRLGRLGRGAAGRLGGAQLEAGRPGHRALQPPRRPGPVGARRLHARHQPAHLGVRVELRRPGRPGGREGQPAHAQARAPHLGGERGQRAVRVHQLPHARRPARRPDEAGRLGVRVGRHRRHRRLRHPARAQRRRHAGGRGVEPRAREAARGDGLRERHRPRRRGLPVLDRRAHPGRGRVAAARQEGPRPHRRRPADRVRAPRPLHLRARRCSSPPAAARSSPAPPRPASCSSTTTATSG